MRSIVAAIGLLICLYGMWATSRGGASRLLSRFGPNVSSMLAQDGAADDQLTLVDTAARLSPSDPISHIARATVLTDAGRLEESVVELEKAVALQPRLYSSWMRLGQGRAQIGDTEGALAAYAEAVRLAPHYSAPRFRYGNLLLRLNRFDEGFVQLRAAFASDPSLYPYTLNLAWGAYGGDASAIMDAIRPNSAVEQLTLARFFVKRGRYEDAMGIFRQIHNSVSEEDVRDLIAELIAARRFREAREVWAYRRDAREEDGGAAGGVGVILNSDFESPMKKDTSGFGWQPTGGAQFSLDINDPRAGKRSLRVDWAGNATPTIPVLTQLVLVEPNARYRLSFAARVQQIVTGGLPVVVIMDVSGGSNLELTRSKNLPPGTASWQEFTMEFTAPPGASAVRVELQRQSCSGGPCPIFGRTWLDSFLLQKL